MKNLSISQKFFLVIAVLTFNTVGIIWFASSQLAANAEATKSSISAGIKPTQLLTSMGIELQRARVNLRDYYIALEAGKTGDDALKFKQRVGELAAKLNNHATDLKTLITVPEEKAVLQRFDSDWETLGKVILDIEKAVENNNFALARELLTTRCPQAAIAASKSLEELAEMRSNSMMAVAEMTSASSRTTTFNMMVAAAVSLIAAIGFAVYILSNIKQSLIQAVNLSHQIAHGDLTGRVNTNAKDEAGQLLISLGEMTESLRKTVNSVIQNAEKVNDASTQLSSSTEQLSAASKVQSEATSGTAAAVEEFTVSVSSVAESASDVSRLAESSLSQTQYSNEKISTLVTEIGKVEESVNHISSSISEFITSARKISEMSQQVKEIADQTNLLALNAAIEAARAGEQGKGFAVVADEVRKLAEKSASSANEISEITNNMDKQSSVVESAVKDGLDSINQSRAKAGEAVDTIAETRTSVQDAVRGVNEITQSVREQSNASNSVAKNIEQIAQMVEESNQAIMLTSEATESLEKVARELKQSVSKFKLA